MLISCKKICYYSSLRILKMDSYNTKNYQKYIYTYLYIYIAIILCSNLNEKIKNFVILL